MRSSASVLVPAPLAEVVPFVVDLGAYPQWMPAVHSVEPDGPAGSWNVELRAKVGPFARSKRLRMVRTSHESDEGGETIVFERCEVSGRTHSRWEMTVRLAPRDGACHVTIDLHYGGSLWSAGVLDHVLAGAIEGGRDGLVRAVSARGR